MFEQDGEEPGHQRQRDDCDEGGCRGIGPIQDRQLIDEPSHRAHQRTAGEGAPGAGEEDSEAQRPRPGQKELCRQLADPVCLSRSSYHRHPRQDRSKAQNKAGADGDAGRDEQGVYHPDGAGEVVALHEIPDAMVKAMPGVNIISADDGVAGLSVQQMAPPECRPR